MVSTHPLIGDADYSGVAADHQKDEAEQRHVPSARDRHRHTFSVRLKDHPVLFSLMIFFVGI